MTHCEKNFFVYNTVLKLKLLNKGFVVLYSIVYWPSLHLKIIPPYSYTLTVHNKAIYRSVVLNNSYSQTFSDDKNHRVSADRPLEYVQGELDICTSFLEEFVAVFINKTLCNANFSYTNIYIIQNAVQQQYNILAVPSHHQIAKQ